MRLGHISEAEMRIANSLYSRQTHLQNHLLLLICLYQWCHHSSNYLDRALGCRGTFSQGLVVYTTSDVELLPEYKKNLMGKVGMGLS